MIRRAIVALSLLVTFAVPVSAQADFGIAPGSLEFNALNRDGTLATQAGSHPYAFSLHFKLNTEEPSGKTVGGELRDTRAVLPPGFIGNPRAVPACPRQSFEGTQPACAPETQIGVLRVILPSLKNEAYGPLYNITPPPGVAAQFGFSAVGFTALLSASVRSDDGYAVHVESPNAPLEASEITATIWGSPADPGHNPERGPSGGLTSSTPLLPFITLPTSCGSPPQTTVEVNSKLAPGLFVGETVPMRDASGSPQALTGCEAVPFAPSIEASPSTNSADSASGFGMKLKLPNQGLLNPKEGAVTETEPVKMVVTLPPGVTANPAAANGLAACTQDQLRAATAASGPNQGCPQSSKLGTLVAQSPLLEEPIEGSVYIATPHTNPFDSLLALYIVAEAPQRGVLIKQAGRADADPVTGQITATFDGLPPVPYSSIEVRLREGAGAPLITPRLCGNYTTTAKLYPFSNPGTAVEKSALATINSGAGGAPCVVSEAQLPNSPTLLAGTTVPVAATYSPFIFKLARNDGEQALAGLEATLPGGLVGKLAGVPYCSEGAIATAVARTAEGQGALEASSPSCPEASQVGTVLAGAGAGPTPYYVQGRASLAGPYKGAPLSLVIITPAVAGPFDLGVVTVRAALYVDPSSAQVTVKSDPLPQMLHGIPLDLRSVSVRMDRQNFILNPTSCEEKAITARTTSTTGAVAVLKNHFQVTSCRGLDFSPKLSMKLSGGTTRAKHPAFRAVLTQAAGQANLARLSLTLPPTEFVDPNHVANPCTRPQFNEGKCPSSSVLGKVKAFTPLLDKPLQGPIYFRANGGERDLPDAVADLNGQVHLISVGFVDALHHKGSEESRIRTTIATVPDAPISKVVIELKGGKKHGLLVNSANICKSSNMAIVKMTGQNGKTHNSNERIATSCKK